jgi:hypothetical protein
MPGLGGREPSRAAERLGFHAAGENALDADRTISQIQPSGAGNSTMLSMRALPSVHEHDRDFRGVVNDRSSRGCPT